MIVPVLWQSLASDARDRVYGHERRGATHASSSGQTPYVPSGYPGVPLDLPGELKQTTARGGVQFRQASAPVWPPFEHVRSCHSRPKAVRHAQLQRVSIARRWPQWCQRATIHQRQPILPPEAAFGRKYQGWQLLPQGTDGVPHVLLRRSVLVCDAQLDLPGSFAREQPLPRVTPVAAQSWDRSFPEVI